MGENDIPVKKNEKKGGGGGCCRRRVGERKEEEGKKKKVCSAAGDGGVKFVGENEVGKERMWVRGEGSWRRKEEKLKEKRENPGVLSDCEC